MAQRPQRLPRPRADGWMMIKCSLIAASIALGACAAPDAECVSFKREGTYPCYSNSVIVPVRPLTAAEQGEARLNGALSAVLLNAILLLGGGR